MKAPNITPGPWTFDKLFLGNAEDRRSGFFVNGPDADPLPVRVCDMRCSPESPFLETQANAQAIAALPQCLEALAGLLADKYLADPINADRMAPVRAALIAAGYSEGGAE